MADSTRVAAGHKANLNNPHTSVESKVHSKEVLKEEFGEDVSYKDGKHPGNVAGGLKAAITNPSVSDEAKESAKERLEEMGA